MLYDNDGIYDVVILLCSCYQISTFPQISAVGCASFCSCKNVQYIPFSQLAKVPLGIVLEVISVILLKVEKEQECLENPRKFVNFLRCGNLTEKAKPYGTFLFLLYITSQSLVKP